MFCLSGFSPRVHYFCYVYQSCIIAHHTAYLLFILAVYPCFVTTGCFSYMHFLYYYFALFLASALVLQSTTFLRISTPYLTTLHSLSTVLIPRDVKASRPMWPRGQIIRPWPQPHSFWPRPPSQPHGIWHQLHRNWPRGLEYLQRT